MTSRLPIDDPTDPRLADYRGLTDVALRTRVEQPHGLFIAEGELVIRRAVRTGHRLRSILALPRWLDAFDDLDPAVPRYVASRQVMAQVTGFHVHRGALASVHRRLLPELADLLPTAQRIVVLEDVNTHTNVGAIFRSAVGLGIDTILLSPSCADPLYRRAVRVSMGAVFAVPYARLTPWPAGLGRLRAAGFRLLGLTPEPAAVPLQHLGVGPDDRLALLLGAEGAGLAAGTLAEVDHRVRIPMAAGVDSLNVAAAAAVACYVVGRR